MAARTTREITIEQLRAARAAAMWFDVEEAREVFWCSCESYRVPYPPNSPSFSLTLTINTIAISTARFFSLCFLCLGLVVHAQFEGGNPWEGTRRFGTQSECRIERLSAQELRQRIESEAGVTGYFDKSNEEFDRARVLAVRGTIQSRGLQLPSFSNALILVYIIQGYYLMFI